MGRGLFERADGKATSQRALVDRLDGAVRSGCLSLWRAAVTGGADIAILDGGTVAAAASRSLPGRTFNQGVGFATRPHLVSLAVDHVRSHGATGWVWAEEAPWPGATSEGTAALACAGLDRVAKTSASSVGLVIRKLGPADVGPWAEVMIVANQMRGPFASAWRAMELELARQPDDLRFIGEIDGRPVAAGAVHIHRGVAYLRAGSVLPDVRGRGIQRALIEERIREAALLGCDLVGSIADVGSSSLRNLERAGMRVVAIRHAYPIG